MKNIEVARIFYEIADILEFQGVEFKPRAYRRAAKNIESLSEDIEVIYKKGKLKSIPGIGENIAKKIEEIIKTGKLQYYERLKNSIPSTLIELMKVPGLGPKRAKILYEKLGIKDIASLEKAAKEHKIAGTKGFASKIEEDILRGIKLVKKGEERKLLGFVYPISIELSNFLKQLKEVDRISIAGSLRRMKETIRDIDILVASTIPEKVMNAFITIPDIQEVLAKGITKSSILLKNGIQVDLRVVQNNCFGSALQYFTGSKDHNIKLRGIALKKGYKLSEYGVFDKKTNKQIGGETEEQIYNILGLQYIEPELRENTGEIELAMKNKLPKLVKYSEIKGDFHLHSNYSDGSNSILELAKKAISLKYEYICITDHSQSQKIAHGLSVEKLEKQLKEIEKLNSYFSNFKIFTGIECDIKPDGSLDYENKVLKKLDIVIGAIHSRFKASEKEMTKRILKAFENPHLKIFAHPTGRLINQREPYKLNLEKIFEKANQNNIWMEINAFPERLDLNDINIRFAREFGLKFAIGTDAHSNIQMEFMKFGIATARRGWCTKKDILNCLSYKDISKLVKG